jgi:uncharacterized protein YegL
MTFDADFRLAGDEFARLGDITPNPVSIRRRVVIVLLDLSTSMSFPAGPADHPRPRIELLNEQLLEWLPAVRRQGADSLRDVEFAVISFSGHGVRFLTGGEPQPGPRSHEDGGAFIPAADLELDALEAFGTTPMLEAVNLALDLGAARVNYLAREHQLQTGQVRIVMFTDGSPYDRDLPEDEWQAVAERVRASSAQRHVQFFAFGVTVIDDTKLRAMSGDEGYFPLADFDFAKLLDLILLATSADDPFATIRDVFGWEVPRT